MTLDTYPKRPRGRAVSALNLKLLVIGSNLAGGDFFFLT